jgi:membrane-associated protease RseP (regulator of RpoE activity)
MSYPGFSSEYIAAEQKRVNALPRILVHVGLFLLTFFMVTVAGVQWYGADPFELSNLHLGLAYGFSLLFFLSAHEFGHYFAARHHGVVSTLPYYIPFPPNPFVINFGTLGAVIRTKSPVPSRKALFDIGVAGPVAGFIASVLLLVYGFLHLPGPEYILRIHPNYDFALNASHAASGIPLEFGNTILYGFLQHLLTNPAHQFVPPMSEMYHYPFLCVGWFGLFVTAMNLIPIGQFDGGHILYTMFDKHHAVISRVAFGVLILLGLPSIVLGLLQLIVPVIFHEPFEGFVWLERYSWGGWFLWAMISYLVIKLDHPPILDPEPLDRPRMLLGWFALAVFAVSFSIVPFAISL